MMKRLIPILILIMMLSSCKKSENDFIWEKSYGKGKALFLKTSYDSGFVACGETDGKPYLVRLTKNRKISIDISEENPGLFSSVWFDTSCYITGGSSSGKMLLMRHNPDGSEVWKLTPDGGFYIDYTRLFYTGNGNLLAVGTASPDSSDSGATGLLFVRFDTTGQVITENKITETTFISGKGVTVDNNGNIFLALTRQSGSNRPKASVAKFNDLFQKLWETELYNNPDFGAAGLDVIVDETGNVYVTGKTELLTGEGILNNSFLASLDSDGSIRWKKYLENANSGSALIFDNQGYLILLNKNCCIISITNTDDGSEAGIIRTFSLCDSYTTDAFGSDICINYDGNIILAGGRGGNFYLALKSSQ